MNHLPKKLRQRLTKRAEQKMLRSLPSTPDLVDFSSNDYLGVAREVSIKKKVEALGSHSGFLGNGATGSRLLSGNHPLYDWLESNLAKTHGVASALVFNSGYDANLGFFGSVPQRGDIVFYDQHIHASIRDGIQLGLAKGYKFEHNDLDDLKRKYQVEKNRSAPETDFYIVTESVFSMDGDAPYLKGFADFAEKNKCHLVVDEAHAVGIFGKNGAGMVQQLGLEDRVFARIITFGKAFGCHGAAILGSSHLKQYLVNFARSFIYTTGLPPHSVATISASYDMVSEQVGDEARTRLLENIEYFKSQIVILGLQEIFISSSSAIQCCVIPGNDSVKAIAHQLQESGFNVRPIMSPTVPDGRERLRFCLHSFNSKKEIKSVLIHLYETIQKI